MPSSNILLVLMPPFWPKMPPVGLGYLQRFLEQNGINADILDLNNHFFNLSCREKKNEWLVSCNVGLENNILQFIINNFSRQHQEAIKRMLDYEIIGFSCFKSNLSATLKTIDLLRSRKKDIRIILGGPEITRQFFKGGGAIDKGIRESADFLVVGEGEIPLLNYLTTNGQREKIAAFRQCDNLSNLGFPHYRGLDFNDYPRKDTLPVQFSRGCTKLCRFCSERLLYKGFRRRSPAGVIDEINYHKGKNHTKYFVFFDSLLNADLAALEELCDRIMENFGELRWEAQMVIRSDMSERLLKKVKKSGCYHLFIGLESGCASTLQKMNKGFSPEEASLFLAQLKSAGLSFGVSVIVGYPGESARDFQESLDFILRHRRFISKIEQINPFTYYDGTDVAKEADYKMNRNSLDRMEYFLCEIKQHGFRYTNAFLGNLIEKNG